MDAFGHNRIERLKNAFSTKQAGWICLFVAIINKVIIAWLYTSLVGDKSVYLLFANSFLETGVFAEPVRTIEGGLTYIYNPAINSPLYSLLAVPFLWITKSYIVTQFIITILSWLLFFGGLYKIAKLILKEPWVVHAFILCVGFFIYPHEFSSAPKDTLAVGFTLWCIHFSYQFVTANPNWFTTIAVCICIAGFTLTKLIYASLSFVFPLLLAVLIRKKGKQYFTHYVFLLAGLAFIACSIYMLVILPAKHPPLAQSIALTSNETPSGTGFYPSNLLNAYPFISASFININFWGIQLENLFHFSYQKIIEVFQWMNVALLIVFAYIIIKRREGFKKQPVLILSIASLALMTLVIMLSLLQKGIYYNSSNELWTYVMDARSFLLPMIALQMGVFLLMLPRNSSPLIIKLAFLLIVFEGIHGFYFTVKQAAHSKEVIAANNHNSAIKNVINYIERKDRNSINIITPDNALRRYAEIKGLRAFALVQQKHADNAWLRNDGQKFFAIVHAADSSSLQNLPGVSLKKVNTIPPYEVYSITPL